MTSERLRHAGFTMIELIVVVAVLGIIAGTALPLFVKLHDHRREQDVRAELAAIAEALDAYYYDRASFPPGLRDPGFLGRYLQPGLQGTAITDGFSAGNDYRLAVTAGPDLARVWSRGPDGVDASGLADDLLVEVHGSAPGYRRTRERMRIIVEVLANFLESGGSLTGSWATDRTNLGLGPAYANDGFGTPFQLDGKRLELRSAGPDRVFGTADDLTT